MRCDSWLIPAQYSRFRAEIACFASVINLFLAVLNAGLRLPSSSAKSAWQIGGNCRLTPAALLRQRPVALVGEEVFRRREKKCKARSRSRSALSGQGFGFLRNVPAPSDEQGRYAQEKTASSGFSRASSAAGTRCGRRSRVSCSGTHGRLTGGQC